MVLIFLVALCRCICANFLFHSIENSENPNLWFDITNTNVMRTHTILRSCHRNMINTFNWKDRMKMGRLRSYGVNHSRGKPIEGVNVHLTISDIHPFKMNVLLKLTQRFQWRRLTFSNYEIFAIKESD